MLAAITARSTPDSPRIPHLWLPPLTLVTGGWLAHCCIHVTYLYAALERVCKRHIEKRDPDMGTVITMTISGLQASLGLTTILRWTSSLTATPGPGYGATPPPQTPPSLQILLQIHLLLYIPKKLLLFAKNLLDNLDYFRSRSRCS